MSKKIVIDPGHGGTDPGASGNDIIEKDLTLKISQYMKKRLDELGVPTSITRTDDSTLDPTDRVNKALSFYGNGSDVILVSNHINAGGGDGFEIIYGLRNKDTLAKDISKEIEATGQNVRKYYQRRLPSDSSKDYYYIIRNTPDTEAVLVEYGFLDSTGDDVSQLKNNYEDLAEAVVKALTEYAGYTYIPVESSKTYTVQKGDSLWSISKKYGLTVNELKELNNLTSNLLTIGQKLIVETPSTTSTYTVQKGDTLYGIAKKYNLSVDKLKSINNLTSNTLSIGQVLNLEDSSTKYTVQKGDTLYSIAKKNNLTVDELKKKNNLTSNTLSIGQTLII